MEYLLIGYSFVAVLLGVMIAVLRDTRLFVAVYCLMLVLTVYAGGQLLGQPRPSALNILMEREIVIRHAEFFEGVAIVATVIDPESGVTLLKFPWDEEKAKQLDEALRRAQQQGNGVEVILAPRLDHEGADKQGDFRLKLPPSPVGKPTVSPYRIPGYR